jgi:DNA repair protein RadD
MTFKLRDYQILAINSIFEYFTNNDGNPVVAMPTGCHAKGTEILMYDGSIKAIENIVIGDKIMGPDSYPRNVLKLCRGKEHMAKVTPIKGDSFIVNISHILSLKTTNEGKKWNCCTTGKEIDNICIKDYVFKSKNWKHLRKLWRTGVKFFIRQGEQLELSGWFLGVMLGDGHFFGTPKITTADKEILEKITVCAESIGCGISIYRKKDNKAADYKIVDPNANMATKNKLAAILNRLDLWKKKSEEKFIPQAYKTATEKVRLDLLAGLLDSDGSLDSSGNFDFITKSKRLFKDILFLSRSLGFAAYGKQCKKTCTNNGKTGTYYRCCISGEVSKIPCVVKRKQANIHKQKKNPLVTGFKISPMPEDDFYGFELDKDHLYLTSDFTVHHNTGKSACIGGFIQQVLGIWPKQRFLLLTHVQELIQQDAKALYTMWPTAPIGIYSAGLKQRDTMMPIIIGGVASVVKNVASLGWRDLLIIDEAHMLSPKDDTMYQQTIKELKLVNPNLKVIGFTATPFRLGQGMITDSGLFTDICYDLTGFEAFNRLIAEGYISPLIPKRTNVELDVSNVGISNGDYNKGELQKAVDKQEITEAALREAVQWGQDRKSWLVFASGIDHCEHINEVLQSFGIASATVHSKTTAADREERIRAHKNGTLRALVGYRVLTTGYDNPAIDLIVDLYPTCSPGMHCQKYGRGTRPAPGKSNCLVLDYGKNTIRNGPINDPLKPRKKGQATGDAPVKICEACGMYNHASVRFCDNCGAEFKFKVKIVQRAATEQLLRSDAPIIETFSVNKVIYHRHNKAFGLPSIRVDYYCDGLSRFREWIGLEHSGRFGKKARDWWRQRSTLEPPKTIDEALTLVNYLREPKRITVHVNKSLPEILSYEF